MRNWAKILLLARHLNVEIEECPERFGPKGADHECGFPHECIGGFVLVTKDEPVEEAT